jgi:hypothetical protein
MCNRLWMPITIEHEGLECEIWVPIWPSVVMQVMTTARVFYINKAFGVYSISMGYGELHGVPDGPWGSLSLGMAFNNIFESTNLSFLYTLQ